MTKIMNEFEGLQARLSSALARLEADVQKLQQGRQEALSDLEAKMTLIAAERDQLRAALDAAEEETARLKALARSMAEELDKAASQIEKIIQGGAPVPAAMN